MALDHAAMLRLLRLISAMASLAVAIAAAAQPALPAAQPPAETITVTGTRTSPEAVHQHAIDFVRATGVAAGEVAAARWVEPACPIIVGLNDEPARIVEAKSRSVAADAGIAVAPAPCPPNIGVVFATDGGAVVRDIAARAPRRLAGVRPATVAALRNGPAPIRWWYVSEVTDKDGIGASSEPPPAFGLNGTGSSLPVGEDTRFVQHSTPA